MPGGNCAIPGCGTSMYKNKPSVDGLSVFTITSCKGEAKTKWRNEVLAILKKYRELDSKFIKSVMAGEKWICQRHNLPEDCEFSSSKFRNDESIANDFNISVYKKFVSKNKDTAKYLYIFLSFVASFPTSEVIVKSWGSSIEHIYKKSPIQDKGRRMLVPGALPTQNMPTKSIETPKPKERRQLNIVKDLVDSVVVNDSVYKDFKDLVNRASKWKLQWNIQMFDDTVKFSYKEIQYIVPKYEIIVDLSLEFTCLVYGIFLPDDHILYKKNLRSVKNIRIQDLIDDILKLKLCVGIISDTENIEPHVVPAEINVNSPSSRQSNLKFFHSNNCFVLSDTEKCTSCIGYEKDCIKKKQRQLKNVNTPASKYAPLSKTHPNRRVLALEQKCQEFKEDIRKMQEDLPTKGVELDDLFARDMETIMNDNSEISPFMKMFWEEQSKLRTMNPHSFRYHPMLIRFCLSLYAKSASSYEELRASNILTLPSQRTLRDYRNAIKPKSGFNPEVTQQLCDATKDFKNYQKYVTILMDEMKVKDSLVFDKSTNNLVGFVDLGDPVLNYSSFEDITELATSVLVFYIRGVASSLKFPFAYISTKGVRSDQIMALIWDAVYILETTCKLNVVAVVGDGASSNRKFFRNHHLLDDKIDSDVTYRTKNIFSQNRYIWFISDVPHLMKTTRNCMYHSGDGKYSRNLCNQASSENVELDLQILSFEDLNEDAMAYGVDFYLAQFWKDKRFVTPKHPNARINLVGKEVENVWLPDTVFINSKSSKFHDVTVNNRYLTIDLTDGSVLYHARITTTASCMLDLRYYPFDEQTCFLAIESYGHDLSDIKFSWKKSHPKDPCQLSNTCMDILVYDKQMSNFEIQSATKSQNKTIYHAEIFSSATARFKFKRRYHYFILQVYLPCSLIVMVAWTSFWIQPTAIAARSFICVTSILTLIMMLGIVNTNMPRVSYIKAIDLYLLKSFLFVFGALFEFIIVLNIKKCSCGELICWWKRKDSKKKLKGKYRQKYDEEQKLKAEREREALERRETLFPRAASHAPGRLTKRNTSVHSSENNKSDVTIVPISDEPDCPNSNSNNNDNNKNTLSKNIDFVSRVVFPVLYFAFNVGYWIVYLRKARDG